jgi:hypothetical protein
MATRSTADEVERRRRRRARPKTIAEDFGRACLALALELKGELEGRWPSARYQAKPVEYFREVLGVEPWSRQIEMIEAVRDYLQVAVVSGHKVSKSNTAAGIALWFYCSFEDARVVFTSTTSRQVDGILWRELRRLRAGAGRCVDCRKRAAAHPELKIPIPCPHSALIRDEPAELARTGMKNPDLREIVGFTAKQSEAVSGVSGKNVLYICDEASGVEDPIFQAIKGNLAGGGRLVLFSQGTRDEGEFFDAFHSKSLESGKRYGYKTIHISSEESPNVKARRVVIPGLAEYEWVEARKEEWGEDHPLYRVRVKGEFVVLEEKRIFSLHIITEAEKRWADTPAEGRLHLGVDPAGPGGAGDESAFAPRRGFKIIELRTKIGLSEEGHLGTVLSILNDHRSPRDDVPVVTVDREGEVGAKVYNILRAHADANPRDFALRGVRSSERAWRQPMIYDRVRDELYANFHQWMREGGAIPEDTRLEKELHAPEWTTDIRGRLKASPKKEIRKLIGRSPDRFDAAALSVWELIDLDDSASDRNQGAEVDEGVPALDPYGALDVWQRR